MADDGGIDITTLLNSWTSGAPGALDQLMETVYPELHRIASRYFRGESPAHTLQCTALINEACLRLVRSPAKQWNDRGHLLGFAARLMRGILVDHARARQTGKRGGPLPTLAITDTDSATPAQEVAILDVNSALDELERLDPTQGRVVELRCFGGLSIEETAEVLGVSTSTVKREWIVVDGPKDAHTTEDVSNATIAIEATDTAAYGKLTARAPALKLKAIYKPSNTYALVVPRDDDGNKIADAWERQMKLGAQRDVMTDKDTAPATGSPCSTNTAGW